MPLCSLQCLLRIWNLPTKGAKGPLIEQTPQVPGYPLRFSNGCRAPVLNNNGTYLLYIVLLCSQKGEKYQMWGIDIEKLLRMGS